MEADSPNVKSPRSDTHHPPHSPVPPPPPTPYHEPASPSAYPPNALPSLPFQAHSHSIAGSPLGPRSRVLPEPVDFSQHPNDRQGNAPPVIIPSRSYSVGSLARTPSNPNQPSPIDTRPRQLAALGPPPPECPHQQPPRLPMDHGGHHSGAYPSHDPHMNGAAPAPYPPPANHHNPYNGPPRMGPTQGHHLSPYAQPGVYGQAADYVGAGLKRQVRAVQACNNCRSRKQKCNEGQPCQFCRESGLKCEYKEVPPPKQDRTLHDIATKVNLLMENFASIPGRLDRIERQLRGYQNGEGTLTTPSDRFPAPMPAVAEKAEGSTYNPVREKTPSEPPTTAGKASSGSKYSLPPDASQTFGPKHTQVPDFFEAEITLPADHTTAAHTMLIGWSAMEPFFKDVIPGGTNFPREQEENRGLLKLYGRGEGEDLYDGAHGGSPAAEGTADDVVSTSAPSPGTNSWGIGFTAPFTGADIHQSGYQHNWGGLNPDGTLKIDVWTVRRLHQSYLSHMHPLQPFLDKERLASMVEKFIQIYSPDAGCHNARSPFALPETYPAIPLKRERANDGPVSGPKSRTPLSRENNIERTSGNAIVLLVLAIGRICEHKTHLPGRLGGPNSVVGSSLQMTSIDSLPAAIQPSPVLSNSILASIPSSSIDGARLASRRPRTEQVPTSEKRETAARNMHITPGLAYYAYAAEILGAVHGGSDLSHGQAGVLACLYMGQLARVLESWGWICYACRVCGVLIDKDKESLFPNAPEPDVSDSMDLRKVAPRVSSGVDQRKANLIKFLYWTCLQLESDILAEMSHLRPSGISKDEERIGLPSQIYPELRLDYPEEMNWLYYLAQIQLRKILNRTHLALYSKEGRKKNFWAAIRDDMLEEQLQGWRETLPAWLGWDDSDEPSNDINKARMRAKYYGARYIITRPILHWAIHTNPAPTFLMKQYGFALDNGSDSPDPSENLVSDSLSKASWHKVMMASKRCVESAVQSTIAFDGVESANQRLIVTNIFGTAHAQFGNCLVLAAVRKSWMRDLIPHTRVIALVERTISFLCRLVPISPTLRVDVAILENTLKCLNGEKPDPASVDA